MAKKKDKYVAKATASATQARKPSVVPLPATEVAEAVPVPGTEVVAVAVPVESVPVVAKAELLDPPPPAALAAEPVNEVPVCHLQEEHGILSAINEILRREYGFWPSALGVVQAVERLVEERKNDIERVRKVRVEYERALGESNRQLAAVKNQMDQEKRSHEVAHGALQAELTATQIELKDALEQQVAQTEEVSALNARVDDLERALTFSQQKATSYQDLLKQSETLREKEQLAMAEIERQMAEAMAPRSLFSRVRRYLGVA